MLGDLAELYREFDYFDDEQLLSMAADQSDRYYYRLQNKDDDAYSPGWKGVPFGVGVNGGMLLLHTARARKVGFAHAIADLTHIGAAESEAGGLAEFCKLAEQDTLNLAIAREAAVVATIALRVELHGDQSGRPSLGERRGRSRGAADILRRLQGGRRRLARRAG